MAHSFDHTFRSLFTASQTFLHVRFCPLSHLRRIQGSLVHGGRFQFQGRVCETICWLLWAFVACSLWALVQVVLQTYLDALQVYWRPFRFLLKSTLHNLSDWWVHKLLFLWQTCFQWHECLPGTICYFAHTFLFCFHCCWLCFWPRFVKWLILVIGLKFYFLIFLNLL